MGQFNEIPGDARTRDVRSLSPLFFWFHVKVSAYSDKLFMTTSLNTACRLYVWVDEKGVTKCNKTFPI